MTKEQQEQFKLELEELAKSIKGPKLDTGSFEPFSFVLALDAIFQAKDSEWGPV